jgi:LmbE family N-acetylglucosaminyl deacetylase
MSALPAEHAVCFAIVTRALAQAREEFRLEKHLRKVSPGRQPRPSFSVDLRSKQISSIPLEAIKLIKDEVERSANGKLWKGGK